MFVFCRQDAYPEVLVMGRAIPLITFQERHCGHGLQGGRSGLKEKLVRGLTAGCYSMKIEVRE